MCLQSRVCFIFSSSPVHLITAFHFNNDRYEYHNDGIDSAICYDIDECDTETHRCDENALCINEEGGYKCQCNAGYLGDGFNCQSKYIIHTNNNSLSSREFINQ